MADTDVNPYRRGSTMFLMGYLDVLVVLAGVGLGALAPASVEQDYGRQSQLFEKNVVAQATLDTATRNLETAKQATAEVVAAEDRARQAYGATVDGEHSVIVRLRNELADAQYDLDQTVVRAPTGGFVTELALRPGVYVVPAPFRPAMIFVNDSKEDRDFAAAFQQNALQRVRAGVHCRELMLVERQDNVAFSTAGRGLFVPRLSEKQT